MTFIFKYVFRLYENKKNIKYLYYIYLYIFRLPTIKYLIRYTFIGLRIYITYSGTFSVNSFNDVHNIISIYRIINFIKSQNGLQYNYKGSCLLWFILNDTHHA